MIEKATYPVAETAESHPDYGVWGRAVVARRHLRDGEKSLWAEPAPAGCVMLVLCSGLVTRLGAAGAEALADPGFVIGAGGGILLQAESPAVVVSVRVPPVSATDAVAVSAVAEPPLAGSAFAFVSALLDAPRLGSAGESHVEHVLSELAAQLIRVAA